MVNCASCGMACAPGEFHPYAACLMYRACGQAVVVRANLKAGHYLLGLPEKGEVFVEAYYHRHDGKVTFERKPIDQAPDWVQRAHERFHGADASVDADNAKAADRACLAMIAQGFAWNGENWERPEGARRLITVRDSVRGTARVSKVFPGDVIAEEYDTASSPQPPAEAQAQGGGEVWRPMGTAPRDGTLLRLLVDFEDHATEDTADPAPTIGANSFDNTGEDVWQFAGWCWSHDHFTEGKGTPVGWLPMLDTTPPSAPVGVEGLNAAAVEAGHTTFESMKQCADSWLAVADALNTYTPGWGAKKGTGRECAVAAIAALAQQPAADAGQWVRCTPELLSSGVSCAKTPRRPGDGHSHDHFIAHTPQQPAAVDGLANLAAAVRQHLRWREAGVSRVPSIAELREWAEAFEALAAQQGGAK